MLSRYMSKRSPGDKGEGARTNKTRTLPDEQRGRWIDHPDMVTMLKIYGSSVSFDLPRDKAQFTLGSAPDCDISIPGDYLSRVHCKLERRGDRLRVHDHDSKNGTYFNNVREAFFDVRPGDVFTPAPVRLLAMSDYMRAAYPPLLELLGPEEENAVGAPATPWRSASEVLVTAVRGGNVLVTGEPGCDHARLARTMHDVSPWRFREPVAIDHVPDDRRAQRAIIDRASRSTLIVDIVDSMPVMDAAFASMIFAAEYHIRVIALAPSRDRANAVLGESNVVVMENIALRPVVRRGAMVPRILDRMLHDRGTPVRFDDLSQPNQDALRAYGWPGNFPELAEVAHWIAVIAHEGSLKKAAEAMKLKPTTFHSRYRDVVGLQWPLLGTAPRNEEDL